MRFITKSYKGLRNRRTAFYALIAGIFIFMANFSPVFAATYTVEDIEVDVTAANAVEAREKAFEEAQVKGYKMLAENFLSAEELEKFETPEISTVSAYVKDFEVTREKISATRYAGVYKIRYNTPPFITPKKKTPSDSVSEADPVQTGEILVLPFLEEIGHPVLWRSNPFFEAWIRARRNNQASPAIVPMGDARDASYIRDDESLRYNSNNLRALKQRYRASHAAILSAVPELMPDGTKNLSVAIYRARDYGPELLQQISIRSHRGETTEQFYNRVVGAVNNVFRENWQLNNIVVEDRQKTPPALTGPIQTMVAQMSFTTMRQWVDTKKTLEQTYGVRGVSVKSLSPNRATLTITYQGGVDRLRQALEQNGVGLNDPLTQSGKVIMGQGAIYQIMPRR